MTEVRQQIRARFAQALMDKTRAAHRVFASRVRDAWQHELPAIFVHTPDFRDQVDTDSPREYLRTHTVVVEIYLEQRYDTNGVAIVGFDDDLDGLSQEIENLLLRDVSLGGMARDVRSVRSEIDVADNGERELAAERKTFEVDVYFEPCQGDPARVTDLRKIALRLDLPGKGEVTTKTSPTADGQRDIPLPPT